MAETTCYSVPEEPACKRHPDCELAKREPKFAGRNFILELWVGHFLGLDCNGRE